MTRLAKTLGLLLACLCFLAAGPARAKEPVHWLIWELSPEFIKTGKLAGQGYADKFLKFFIEHLPQYDHRIQWTNVRRWNREIYKPNRCSAHIWNHFFTDELVYSKPYTLTPPHVVIFHERHRERFGPPGSVLSLQALLADEDLTLITLPIFSDAAEKAPRYPLLHPLLAPRRGMPNVVEVDNVTNEVDLRLLARGRADYTIGYPTTITAQRRDRGLEGHFVDYALEEHQRYKTIHASCRDDDFGRTLIRRLDALLSEETLMTFLGYHEEWNGGNRAFRKATREILIDGTR